MTIDLKMGSDEFAIVAINSLRNFRAIAKRVYDRMLQNNGTIDRNSLNLLYLEAQTLQNVIGRSVNYDNIANSIRNRLDDQNIDVSGDFVTLFSLVDDIILAAPNILSKPGDDLVIPLDAAYRFELVLDILTKSDEVTP